MTKKFIMESMDSVLKESLASIFNGRYTFTEERDAQLRAELKQKLHEAANQAGDHPGDIVRALKQTVEDWEKTVPEIADNAQDSPHTGD